MTTLPTRTKRDRLFTRMRWTANVLVLVGYFTLLNVNLTTGIIIRIVSASLVIPWMASNKIWDGLGVMGIMTSIDIHKLITIFFGF